MAGKRKRPDPPATGVLDWRSGHWSGVERPCRYCKKPTPLKDSKGKAAHKVCAEQALAEQEQDQAEAYENERLKINGDNER